MRGAALPRETWARHLTRGISFSFLPFAGAYLGAPARPAPRRGHARAAERWGRAAGVAARRGLHLSQAALVARAHQATHPEVARPDHHDLDGPCSSYDLAHQRPAHRAQMVQGRRPHAEATRSRPSTAPSATMRRFSRRVYRSHGGRYRSLRPAPRPGGALRMAGWGPAQPAWKRSSPLSRLSRSHGRVSVVADQPLRFEAFP
jgi:hypothetical protein